MINTTKKLKESSDYRDQDSENFGKEGGGSDWEGTQGGSSMVDESTNSYPLWWSQGCSLLR